MKTICHVGIMGDIYQEGLIAQYIFMNCEGNHIYTHIDSRIPKADIYILHCMKNLLYLDQFITFMADGKIISLVHSSEPCMPSKNSDLVIVLTKYWKKRLYNLYNIDSIVIPGGIDLGLYNPDKRYFYKKTNRFTFGKISRPEPGKYHKDWNETIKNFLNDHKKSECQVISNGYKKLNHLKHSRMKWIEGINISDHTEKIKALSQLDLYIEMHSDSGSAFVDTFNMSMLEAMALGIPVLMLRGLQGPMEEVLSAGLTKTGVIAYTKDQFIEALENFYFSSDKDKKDYSEWSRSTALYYSHTAMINKWNEVLQ